VVETDYYNYDGDDGDEDDAEDELRPRLEQRKEQRFFSSRHEEENLLKEYCIEAIVEQKQKRDALKFFLGAAVVYWEMTAERRRDSLLELDFDDDGEQQEFQEQDRFRSCWQEEVHFRCLRCCCDCCEHFYYYFVYYFVLSNSFA
jgi:hypothetical protein